mmetsp:Transcript_23721/g.51319  ORF Transcript_23721/g.51319 Transcript_23721/m.51319 type:complete len:85 (+) Transcript_23721:155-409(+)
MTTNYQIGKRRISDTFKCQCYCVSLLPKQLKESMPAPNSSSLGPASNILYDISLATHNTQNLPLLNVGKMITVQRSARVPTTRS